VIYQVDQEGNEIAFVGHKKQLVPCGNGFLEGRWIRTARHMGVVMGRWINRDGSLAGHFMGYWGIRRDGQKLFFGKCISHNGEFRWLIRARWGYRLGTGRLLDAMINDGLWDSYNDFHMGMTGEIIAEKYEITREQMDQFAYESHMKAATATYEGLFKEEIMPVEIPQKKKDPIIFDKDEGIRGNTTPEILASLRTQFKKDGMLTAGNCSQLSDGASAVVVMSADKAKERGLKPLAKITGYVSSGVEPELVMEAPIPAIKMLLEKLGKKVDDIDLYEHNEAFASASCAVAKGLDIPMEKLNVHGGAVALGHPIGASGARVLTTLIYAMKNREAKTGIATLCLGGGNAVAMSIEM